MNQKDIIEVLCASSNGVVVERRKNIIIPIVVLLVGVAILIINSFIENGDDANNLKSALVLVGGAISLIGTALCVTRIFGGGAPYHTVDKCFLARKRYCFDKSDQAKILKTIDNCDKNALDAIKESDIAGVAVECYYSPRSKFCAMQAFAFEELVYKSISELKVKL